MMKWTTTTIDNAKELACTNKHFVTEKYGTCVLCTDDNDDVRWLSIFTNYKDIDALGNPAMKRFTENDKFYELDDES